MRPTKSRRGWPPAHGAAIALLAGSVLWSAGFASSASPDIGEAARRGDLAEVRHLLESDPAAIDGLDRRGPYGMTALLWAAQANDVELARVLLEAGADPNLGNRYGIAPLWLAATNRNAALVAQLLENGADAESALPHGETALMAAARAGDEASIRLLLAAGADPNASEASHGETALMWAAAENHVEAIRALVAGGADPNRPSLIMDLAPMDWQQIGMVSTLLPVGGWTPIMYAARQNAPAAALTLVELGADPDAQDPDGTTALILAIMNAHNDLAALLLEAGADPNVADRAGMTALYTAVDEASQRPPVGRPPLPRLAKLDTIDIVRLALEHGADPNAQLESPIIGRYRGFPDRALGAGSTALMRAATRQDLESMRLLLAAGADPNLRQANGAGVVHLVAGTGPQRGPGGFGRVSAPPANLDVLGVLIEGGADINAVGPDDETPLHRAARQGDAAAVAFLLEHGARLDARNAAEQTPRDIVAPGGPAENDEIAALLDR